MSLKALVFDVDGTLGRTEPIHREAFNEAFRRLGLDWHWDDKVWCELMEVAGGGGRLRHYVERYHPDQLEQVEREGLYREIHRTKTRLFGRLLEDSGTSLRLGVGRLITDARSAGVRLAACTTSQLETFEILIINALGFEAISWFSTVVSGDDVKKKKPDPEGYLEVLRRLRIRPDEAVVIEDSARGVEAARAAGIQVIAVPNELTRGEDFTGARLVLSDLGEPGVPFEVIAGDPHGFGHASVRAIKSWMSEAPSEAGAND